MTTIYGMAVLLVHFAFIFLSYLILKRLDWRKLFSQSNYYMAQYACLLLSVAIGFSVSSFILTIIEILQNMFWSII